MAASLPGGPGRRAERGCRLVRVAAVSAALLAIGATPPASRLDPYELGIAQREAGRLRGLVERLSKQNLLYQLHLGGVRKHEMQETAAEIDRLIEILERGSSAYAVAPPPSQSVLDQLEIVSDAWTPIRRMALASPYDYLRYSSDLLPKRSRLGDPLLIRAFDRHSQGMIGEAGKLMVLYQEECTRAGGELCELAANSGFFTMLAERVAKELVLVYAGIDPQESIDKLRESREMFETQLVALGESPVLVAAADPERGSAASVVERLWTAMREDWAKLRFEVDLAIDDRAEALDIPRMLDLQRRLVDEMERLRAALSRYAAYLEELD